MKEWLMRLLGKTPPPEQVTAHEQRVHAALDKVETETTEARRLSRAWLEVRRAEQVITDRRRTE